MVPMARGVLTRHNLDMQKKILLTALAMTAVIAKSNRADACTGITLKSDDKSVVVGRTIDWSGAKLNSNYVIVPRNHVQRSLTPDGKEGGMEFTSVYGYVGLSVEEPRFVVDGTNEAGLSAGLFYFPGYGQYQEFDQADAERTIADFQFVPWILSSFSTIDQVKDAVKNVRIVNVDKRSATVHWRITEASGRQAILEIVDGVPHFYDSQLGVLTNSPGYEWHLTNLNNYVNLMPGTAGPSELGALTLKAFGSGSGFLGLPGDFTPPSRFVRAAFLSSFHAPLKTGYAASMHAFHILNNFDVPLAVQYAKGRPTVQMPSATQWTIVTDMGNRKIYYRTMYNSAIREIDMVRIDFENVLYQSHPLDAVEQETILPVIID